MPSARRVSLGTVVAVVTLIGGVLAINSQLTPKTVDRPQAVSFLNYYYKHSVQDPSTCCYDLLDGAFRQEKHTTKAGYVAFFRQFSKIDVTHVRDAGGDGQFSAMLTYYRPDGNVSAPEKDKFQLKCTSATRLFWVDCDVGHTRIHDAQNRYN
jgi:hypothetical protein